MEYGKLPVNLGVFVLPPVEMMFYQYLPIKLAGSSDIQIEDRHQPISEILGVVGCRFIGEYGLDRFMESYMYLTMKSMYKAKGCFINRPGWHSDGFGTDDVNYIWSDKNGTEFTKGPFSNISNDHLLSMKQFEEQAKNPFSYEDGTLLELTPSVIHRVNESTIEGVRTFIKISFSREKYNLQGNSINSKLNYKWEMLPREKHRNHPIK